tara:strand:+ start:550 stop:933 length:384 start_codon:yes stop_codon:yes gene_type:complete
MNTLKQTETPLNSLFFSQQNVNVIQKTMRHKFKGESGLSIDRQDDRDLFALMRAVFIMYEQNPYGDAVEQVKNINEVVVNKALEQIRTNVSQFMTYVRDMDQPIMPLATPENTSVYGTRISPESLKF